MRHRFALVLRRLAYRIDPERRGGLRVPSDNDYTAFWAKNLMVLYAADKACERKEATQ